MEKNKSDKIKFILIGTFLIGIYIALIPLPRVDNNLLTGDGFYYYSFLRSFIYDLDFNIKNELTFYNSTVNNPQAELKEIYCYSIGPSILWTPFFGSGLGLNYFYGLFKKGILTNGYSFIVQALVAIGNIIYFTFGLYFLFLILMRFYNRKNAYYSILIMTLSTPLIYYALIEPTMTHCLDFFTVTLFLYFTLKFENNLNFKKIFFLGVLLGIVSIVRWQNIIVYILFITILIDNKFNLKKIIYSHIIFIFGLFLGLFPQLFFWEKIYGSLLLIPQGKEWMIWLSPEVNKLLFSTNHGILTWHPILILCFIGIILFTKTKNKLGFSFILIIILQIYICSSVSQWWSGGSFGQRRFIGMYPFLVIGICALIEKINSKILIITGGILFSFYNLLLLLQYGLNFIPHSGYLTFKDMFIGRFLIIFDILKKLHLST